jgi:hypothetical protein
MLGLVFSTHLKKFWNPLGPMPSITNSYTPAISVFYVQQYQLFRYSGGAHGLPRKLLGVLVKPCSVAGLAKPLISPSTRRQPQLFV